MKQTRLISLRVLGLAACLLMGLNISASAAEPINTTVAGNTSTATGGSVNACSMQDYYNALGKSENAGAYGGNNCNGKPGSGCACNTIGCCGKYQFCPSTLAGLGYSRDTFINSPEQQEEAIRRFTDQNYQYLSSHGAGSYIGQTINGTTITWSGLLGAAHLGGAGGAMKFLTTGGAYNPDDGNTKLSDYINKFNGYDTEAGGGGGSCKFNAPSNSNMTEVAFCDPNIRNQITQYQKAHQTYLDERMHQVITGPADRNQIANSPCVSQELNNVTNQFSNAAGSVMNIGGSSPASSILNDFFKSGFTSINNASGLVPQMLNFQSQASSILGGLLSNLGIGGQFNSDLCGMMMDMLVKYIECKVPFQMPSFDFSLNGGLMNLNLPDSCEGQAARSAIYGATQQLQGEGLSQAPALVNGLITGGNP